MPHNTSFNEIVLYIMDRLPEKGKYYHFWDDGKSSASRHYICKCERIISCDESRYIEVETPDGKMTLYDMWKENVAQCYWLYAETTDYMIECSCPKYDKDNLWFVRTKNGEWFSIDIQSWWQSGLLDVDSKKYDEIIKYRQEEGWSNDLYTNETY